MTPAYHQVGFFDDRRCHLCGEMRPRSEFCRNNSMGDGIDPRCRPCKSKQKRAWYEKNRDKQLSYRRAYYQSHADQCRAASRLYYHKHKGEIREAIRRRCEEWRKRHPHANRIWRSQNMQHLREYAKARYHLNPEQHKAWRGTSRRRALVSNPERVRLVGRQKTAMRRAMVRRLQIGEVSYAAILERDKSICHICGLPVERQDLHFDHVIPIARGGPHSMDNIKTSHQWCNQRKGANLIEQATGKAILKPADADVAKA